MNAAGLFHACAGLLEGAASLSLFCRFAGAGSGKRPRWIGVLTGAVACAAVWYPGGLPVFLAALLVCGVWGLGLRPEQAALGAVLAAAVLQLSFGACQSLAQLLAPVFFPPAPALFCRCAMLGGEGGALLLAGLLCRKALRPGEGVPMIPRTAFPLLFPPLLLAFAAGKGIDSAFYGNTVTVGGAPQFGLHLWLLAVQGTALATVCGVPAACRFFAERERLRKNAEQIRLRYDRTVSLRHDLKNHLTVTRGLLGQGRTDDAQAYLAALGSETAALSFPFRTGCAALDVLLAEKAARASRLGVPLRGMLRVPEDCPMDALALCILFGNALDNALNACAALPEGTAREIRLSARRQGALLLFSVENTFSGGTYRAGTGLRNMRRAVKKYGGRLTIETTGEWFCLRVLLDVPAVKPDA